MLYYECFPKGLQNPQEGSSLQVGVDRDLRAITSKLVNIKKKLHVRLNANE